MGRIACANVLSDIYAMGIVDCANMLMLLGVSNRLSAAEREIVLPRILKGFQDCAKEAGTVVNGGQTVFNPWMLMGGVATAVCTQQQFILPSGARTGDVLVLTKPLGTQVSVNAYQWLDAYQQIASIMTEHAPSGADLEQNTKANAERWNRLEARLCSLPSSASQSSQNGTLLDQDARSNPSLPAFEPDSLKQSVINAYLQSTHFMTTLNRTAARLMHKHNAHAATDVTGFGLLGHAQNLASAQEDSVCFAIHSLPIIANMVEIDAAYDNKFKLLEGKSSETSGGLLIAMSRADAERFCAEYSSLLYTEPQSTAPEFASAWIVGDVLMAEATNSRTARILPEARVIKVAPSEYTLSMPRSQSSPLDCPNSTSMLKNGQSADSNGLQPAQ